MNQVWGWVSVGAGWTVLVAGCGDSAQDSARSGVSSAGAAGATLPAAPAGTGNDGAPSPGGWTGAGADPHAIAGAGPCVGELAQVAKSWGECPTTLCAAEAWAADCSSLNLGDVTEVGTCDMLRVVTIRMGSTHGKDCYYELASSGAQPNLVGAASWDDIQVYCNETSFRIEAGKTTANCGAFSNASAIVCNGPSSAPSAATGSGGEGGTACGTE